MSKLLPFRRPRTEGYVATDEALVAACTQGDSAALGELFDRHHEGLHQFLVRANAGIADGVDDLVQQTFMEVLRSAPRFRGSSTVRSWIFGIGNNLRRRDARTWARRRALTAAFGERSRLEPGGPQPDEAFGRREARRRIQSALEALPDRLREAFVVCDVEGMSGVEAARTLGLREGTLYRRLHEARRALRAALGEDRP